VKVKNPEAPAVKREAEEDWGRWGELFYCTHSGRVGAVEVTVAKRL